ncbi:hypothetical protein [Hoeflea poritis]|uniref:MacB-like periplasmic core domain-containing protein n=1 Tax=Hoeflea poritis TaxID=2993659 RepID=A0ABT4VSC2_9HYPH|nr:hypothetical protein [Hoeflea poritis]MDA4847609.1 hypothetical protein [Hoeflea poritis]
MNDQSQPQADLSGFVNQLKRIHLMLMLAALIIFTSVYITSQDQRMERAKAQFELFDSLKAEHFADEAHWATQIALEAWKEGKLATNPVSSERFSGWIEVPRETRNALDGDGTVIADSDGNIDRNEVLLALTEQLIVGLSQDHELFETSSFIAKKTWTVNRYECDNVVRSKIFETLSLSYPREFWDNFSRLKIASLGHDFAGKTYSLAIVSQPGEDRRNLVGDSPYFWLDSVRLAQDDGSVDAKILTEFISNAAVAGKAEDQAEDLVEYIPLKACILDRERKLPQNHILKAIEPKLDRTKDLLYLFGDFTAQTNIATAFGLQVSPATLVLFPQDAEIIIYDGRPAIKYLIGSDAEKSQFQNVFPEMDYLIRQTLRSLPAERRKLALEHKDEQISDEEYEERLAELERLITLREKVNSGEVDFPRRTQDAVEIQGLSFHVHDIALLGAIYIVLHQMYFFLHFKTFVSRVAASGASIKLSPWLGIYDDRLSRFVFITSIAIIPICICIWRYFEAEATADNAQWYTQFFGFLGIGENFPFVLGVVLFVGIVASVILAVRTYLLHRALLAELARRSPDLEIV